MYFKFKSNYTNDGKIYVITKNGLWIKDKIDERTIIINASSIEGNYLIQTFITEFDNDFKVTKNIKSEKIDITNNTWITKKCKSLF